MVNPTRHDVAAIAAVGGGGGMSNAVECRVTDGDGKVRNATWGQEHLAPTIGTGSHEVDRSDPL